MPDTPINTTKQPPEAHLLGLLSGSDDYITGMEARGQRELVRSQVLPNEILGGTDADFEALGFTFGEPVEGDPLFRHAALPAGWTRQGTDHAMWSHILDERSIERAAVFYKAAFYDRSAHMSLTRVASTVGGMLAAGEDCDAVLAKLTPEELNDVRRLLPEMVVRTTGYLEWATDQTEALYRADIARLNEAIARLGEVPA